MEQYLIQTSTNSRRRAVDVVICYLHWPHVEVGILWCVMSWSCLEKFDVRPGAPKSTTNAPVLLSLSLPLSSSLALSDSTDLVPSESSPKPLVIEQMCKLGMGKIDGRFEEHIYQQVAACYF